MEFLKPTDGPYKFMALGGIILVVLSVVVPVVFFLQTGMEYLDQDRSSGELKVHEEFTKKRLDTLKLRQLRAANEIKNLETALNKLTSRERAPRDSSEVNNLWDRINDANRKSDSIEDASYELEFNLALRQTNTANEETVSLNRRRDSRLVLGLGFVATLIGLIMSSVGFPRWLKQLQQFQARIIGMTAGAQPRGKTQADNKIERDPNSK